MDKKEIAKSLIFTEIDLLRNAVIYEDIKANDFCNHSEDGKCKIFKCKCKVVDNTCSNYDNDKIIDEINNIISIFSNALKPTVLPIKCIDKKEMINHPSHYNQGKYEAIDVFKSITGEMTRLFEIKNKNYGNSFSKQFEEYGLTSVCIRLEDKLNRLKSLNKQLQDSQNGITDVNMDDESIKDTLIDLANYSVLAIMELNKGE